MWPRVLEAPARGWRSSFRCAPREGNHDEAGKEGEEVAEEGGEKGAEEGMEVGEELHSVGGMRRLAEELVENEL